MKSDQDHLINLHDMACIEARRPVLIAHRGGVIAANAPENSLGAIHLAAVHGYDMVELDVREAKDGKPVLFHGSSGHGLFTDCGVPNFVEELTSDELATLKSIVGATYSSDEEVDHLLKHMPPIIENLRDISPFWKDFKDGKMPARFSSEKREDSSRRILNVKR